MPLEQLPEPDGFERLDDALVGSQDNTIYWIAHFVDVCKTFDLSDT